MDDDRPWLGDEPSARPDPTFHAIPTAIGTFTAVVVPFIVYGFTRPNGTDSGIIAIGAVIALLFAVLVGVVIHREGGHPPGRGPRV